MSIEQHQEFHVARRILRSLAPEYRLLATENLKSGDYLLDSRLKTIEIAEKTEIIEAIAKLLFLMGHVSLEKEPVFAPLFGKNISEYKGKENELITALVELGLEADKIAASWAVNVFCSFWDISHSEAKTLIESCLMTEDEWRKYFVL